MDNTQEVLDIWWLDSLESLNPLPALGFIGDVSVEPLTAAAEIQTALTKVNQQLTEFVASASFAADLQTAFGAYKDVITVRDIYLVNLYHPPNLGLICNRKVNPNRLHSPTSPIRYNLKIS
ncbi:hypothetical protein [Limnospira platensis]|uniref:hypothetical protein n=1 Tax=Limnospira platensis TaxID=118562 RepID=UPI000280454C|nr:hemolysin-type calcium-binding region [Arthrospira platensis C1]UWU51317.1 hypothetical protein APLC1_6277 [Arthrospira platensis C1]